ncbi:MAG: LOG family protein [Hyphomicrobiaceae bacterium]
MSMKPPHPLSAQASIAFEDRDFLMREEMRANRIALEFSRADLLLRDQGVKSTIVVFGSARTRASKQKRSGQPSTQKRQRGAKQLPSQDLSTWYAEAREFGRISSERGGALSPVDGVRENIIATGGGPGIMEAANRGAAEAGAPTIGFNISLPTEQRPNKYITPGLSFQFQYFAVRKMHFAIRANALAIFPGGLGTLDELFEVLTLKQTRKITGMPVILFCRGYWERVIDFSALLEMGTISAKDIDLFKIVDSAEEGWQAMLEYGLTTPTPLREI